MWDRYGTARTMWRMRSSTASVARPFRENLNGPVNQDLLHSNAAGTLLADWSLRSQPDSATRLGWSGSWTLVLG